MRAFFTLTRRELATYFVSLTGYIIMAAVLLLVGLSFWNLLEALRGEGSPVPITELFFNSFYFWIILLLSTPVITMRLFALEKYAGTFETLMTTPVSDLEVVLAKFSGAFIFYVLTWLPVVGYIWVLRRYTADSQALDWGTIGGTFGGVFLVGSLFMALGCFASALTRSQIIAAMISLAAGVGLVLLGFLAKAMPASSPGLGEMVNYTSMFAHMEDFSRGLVDTRAVVFYVSATFFFLFLTYRVVESRRWK